MDIYEELVRWRREGRCAALATITGVHGSIPSFEAAKMMVCDDGSIAGSIGGGCVEAEVWQAAREVIEQKTPRMLAFNLNKNPKYDTGLVCGGSLEIFIEPLLPVSDTTDVYEELVRWRRDGHRAALVTAISLRASDRSLDVARMLIRDDGTIAGSLGGDFVEAGVIEAARGVIEQEEPRKLACTLDKNPGGDSNLACDRVLEIFIEPLFPVPTVYVFGAGHVGYNVYRVARVVGFEVVVVDDREAFANRGRFPDARDVHADEFDSVMAELAIHEAAFIVIATRGHRDDMRVLRWAANTPAHYIGMIGSKRKVITIYRELEKEGISPDKLDRVSAPIGIDIGARTPEEIGVSVVAELIAARCNSKTALPHLRLLRKLVREPQPAIEEPQATS
jgi:xanthine dehydrogenase accessory factor